MSEKKPTPTDALKAMGVQVFRSFDQAMQHVRNTLVQQHNRTVAAKPGRKGRR